MKVAAREGQGDRLVHDPLAGAQVHAHVLVELLVLGYAVGLERHAGGAPYARDDGRDCNYFPGLLVFAASLFLRWGSICRNKKRDVYYVKGSSTYRERHLRRSG